jgi:hypothetical protein
MIGSDLRILRRLKLERVSPSWRARIGPIARTPSRLSDHCISKIVKIVVHFACKHRIVRRAAAARRRAASARRGAAAAARRRGQPASEARAAAASEQRSRRLRVGQLLCAVAATDSESLSAGPGPGPGPQSRSQSALSDGTVTVVAIQVGPGPEAGPPAADGSASARGGQMDGLGPLASGWASKQAIRSYSNSEPWPLSHRPQ